MAPAHCKTAAKGGTGKSDYQCLSAFSGHNAHLESAPELYVRGVWIGHSNEEKSYKGLPSFKALKQNFIRASAPFPPAVRSSSTTGDGPKVACAGCLDHASELFRSHKLEIVSGKRVHILKLEDDGASISEGFLFCILVPQPPDQDMPRLRAFRPWKICKDGDRSNSNIVLLSLRNHTKGLEDPAAIAIVRDTLGNLKYFDNAVESDGTLDEHDVSTTAERKRKSIFQTDPTGPSPKRQAMSDAIVQVNVTTTMRSSTRSPTEFTPRPPVSLCRDSVSSSPSSVRSDRNVRLSDDLASRIHFTWTLPFDDMEYECVQTLSNCVPMTCAALFDKFRRSAQVDADLRIAFENTSVWGMTYKVPGQTQKLFVIEPDSEAAFRQMLRTLSEAPLWYEGGFDGEVFINVAALELVLEGV
ncbi:hypothetical protein GQ43DRAFT_484343 [Delitschia confertaspora ATCC 74209]|uniref:Uncharacterized protein n=1 Tax=Delitschia confertaspora ATCC 74209 TaxID=1513339 RepID=A0A9P4MNQ1_9PLEO|nr:hypothetical protein GQ43DRAFT_484343 [Delitschia confertaspora ATCC 74209]